MSADRKDGGPAFPVESEGQAGEWRGNEWVDYHGMSLRDYFAGQALAGILSSCPPINSLPYGEVAAEDAYAYADAMLKTRGRE